MSSLQIGDGARVPVRRTKRALAGIVAVVLAAATVVVVPLAFTLWGGVLLVAWLQDAWDPTWNDGDGWYSAVAAVVVIAALSLVGTSAGLIAWRSGLPVKRFVAVAVGGTVATALLPIVLFASWQLFLRG